ncbi:MAG: hypothetical protein GYA21_06575 [Myxococcales bacterium]|nr:hypothetical protein [Myxococcales bacterium]
MNSSGMASRRLLPGIVLSLLLACPARAGEIFFLPPEGCLPGDGGPEFAVHVLVVGAAPGGKLALRSSLGSFSAPQDLGRGLYQALYRPPTVEDRAEVLFEGEWTVPGAVGVIRGNLRPMFCRHPCGTLEISASPAELVAERDRTSEIVIQARDPAGAPLSGLPLVVTTNVGQLSPVEDLGGGKYRLRFDAPSQPFPQVAVITAADPSHARLERVAAARLTIPIAGRLELPGKTTPGVRMEMRVAEKTFGPVTADEKGRFSIPILVPPGYGRGRATSIDRVGNRKVAEVNLFLPPTNQLGIWAFPRALPANGRSRARLLVTTVDPFGHTADLGEVRLRARFGVIGDLRPAGRGLWEAYYTAPAEVAEGLDRIEATFPKGGSESRSTVEIRLSPGIAARAVLEAAEALPADGKTSSPLRVTVTDRRGNRVPNLDVRLRVRPGSVSPPREESPGKYLAEVVVPARPERWSLDVEAEILDRTGSEPAAILASPESLTQGASGVWLEAALVDAGGFPVPQQAVTLSGCGEDQTGTTDRFGRVRFRLQGLSRDGLLRCRLAAAAVPWIEQRLFLVRDQGGLWLLPVDLDEELPLGAPLSASSRVALVPERPCDITLSAAPPERAGGAFRVTAHLRGADGEPLAGRRVIFASSSGRVGNVVEGPPGTYQVEVYPAGLSDMVVSATEAQSQVGALIRIGGGKTP